MSSDRVGEWAMPGARARVGRVRARGEGARAVRAGRGGDRRAKSGVRGADSGIERSRNLSVNAGDVNHPRYNLPF